MSIPSVRQREVAAEVAHLHSMTAPPLPTSPHLAAILSAKVQGDGAEYTALLRQLSASEPAAAAQTLQALAQVASCVKLESHANLVEVALRQRWRDDQVLGDATLSFVQEVVSASPGFLRPCLDALVCAFLPEETRERKSSRSPAASSATVPPPSIRCVLFLRTGICGAHGSSASVRHECHPLVICYV